MARARASAILGLLAATQACAGGAPLLHPAHVLPSGEVRAVAGLSAQAVTTGMNSAIRDAQASPPDSAAYAKGALVATLVAPGLAPVVGARVGAGGGVEGGVTYTGRGARLDLRKAFSTKSLALSIGAGFDAAFLGRQTNPLPAVDMASFNAYGFDVPVIVGWRSTAGLYQAWGGVRGGYDHGTIALPTTEPSNNLAFGPRSMSGDHAYVGGLVGLAIGLNHLHVALELDASYVFLSGTFGAVQASASGLVLTPGSALSWDF